jgi:hypothetical protein
MLLTNVSKTIADLVIVTRGALSPRASVRGGVAALGIASPRALACAGAVVVPGPQADEVASPPLRVVAASEDRPLKQPWAVPYWLDILDGSASPRG